MGAIQLREAKSMHSEQLEVRCFGRWNRIRIMSVSKWAKMKEFGRDKMAALQVDVPALIRSSLTTAAWTGVEGIDRASVSRSGSAWGGRKGEGRVKMAKAQIGVAEVWGRIWVWQDGGEDRWAWLRGGIK